MKKIIFLSFTLITLFLGYSCSTDDDFPDTEGEDNTENVDDPTIPEDTGDEEDDALVPNPQEVNYANAVNIAFSTDGATIENSFEGSGVAIENTNGHVVITSTLTGTEVNYVLSGIIPDGSLKIYSQAAFGLVLNGVGITNSAGAAINIQSKSDVKVYVTPLTANRLIDSETYTYTTGEDMKGTFFSEGNLTFSQSGTLEIRGKNKHALASDGYITISDADINIKEAAGDGINTNDEVTLNSGTLTIRSVGDGIQSDSKEYPVSILGGDISITTTGEKGHGIKAAHNINITTGGTITMTLYGDAAKGLKPAGDLNVYNGDININTAGNSIFETDEQDTSSAAAIKVDGNMLVENGTLTLLSTGSGGKGINVDGTLTINDGIITVTTTGDQYVYNSSYDTASKAIKSDGNLTVNGGTITIRTSKTEAEGLESKSTLTIKGGEIDIEAYDDCINASTHIQIDGGYIYCKSTVNDAIDSNGTLSITGGTIVVAGASAPEGGIDCDQSRFAITGGTIVGIGGATSTPTASASSQRSVIFYSSTSGIEVIRIESSEGADEILTLKLPKTYSQNLTMLFSSAALAANTAYTIYTGGSISGGTSFHGLYTGATYSGGTSAGTFTTSVTSGAVSTVGTPSGGGPGGGGGGPR